MPKIVFDSSFLLAVAATPTAWSEGLVDLVGRYQPVLLECVSAELQKLASSEGKRAGFARTAIEMAGRFAKAPCGRANVDDEIVSYAKTQGAMVATVDGELIRTLRSLRLGVVTLKSNRVAMG